MPFALRRPHVLSLVLFVTALPAPLAAQVSFGTPRPAPTVPAARQLTLEDARQTALAGNKSLALARLNVIEKGFVTAAARTDYLPKLLGNVTYFHFDQNLGKILTFQTGKLGLLPVGTSTVGVPILNQNSALSTLFVAQPITKLIAVNAAVQIARADEGAARAQLDKGTRDLLSGVTQAYHALLGAQRIQQALELQIKLLEEVVALKPAPELRVALLEARQGLLQVRGQAAELAGQINSLLDYPSGTVLELVDPVPGDLPVSCAEDAARLALACSPEMREAEQTVSKAEAALRVARMEYLPDVNVIGGVANQTGADYIQPNMGYLGLTANYTFWDWGKRRDIRFQRKTQITMANQNLQVTSDKVHLDAEKAYQSFDQAREAYNLANEMVEARRAIERGAHGEAALQAKADTSKAELEVMKAEITFRVAHAQLGSLICSH